MKLTGKDRRWLRSQGHHLRPVVMIGREGLTDAVLTALDQAHNGSELIKLKILEPSQHDRKAIRDELDETRSTVVGMVGGVLLLYRRDHESPKLKLPSENGTAD